MSLVEYKKELLRRKLSDVTIEMYISSLRMVERFLKKPLEKANKKDIGRFLDSINDNEPNTIIIRLRALKQYFKWLKKPKVADFPLPKNHSNSLISADMLTEDEVLKLIDTADNLRDKCLISLLFDSACRRGEVLGINIEDVFIETDRTGYIVVNGKTGKREVPLSFSIPALKNWINVHPLKSDPKSPLFCSLKQYFGKRLYDDYLRLTVLKVARRAGIKKRVFCHLFRHSRLTQLDKRGLSHTAMKYFAGWSRNSSMPNVYSHFSAQDTKELVYQVDGIQMPKKKAITLEPIICAKCNTPNDKTNKYCYLCGMGLDEESRKEFEIQELLKMLIKADPDLSRTISEKIKQIKSNKNSET